MYCQKAYLSCPTYRIASLAAAHCNRHLMVDSPASNRVNMGPKSEFPWPRIPKDIRFAAALLRIFWRGIYCSRGLLMKRPVVCPSGPRLKQVMLAFLGTTSAGAFPGYIAEMLKLSMKDKRAHKDGGVEVSSLRYVSTQNLLIWSAMGSLDAETISSLGGLWLLP